MASSIFIVGDIACFLWIVSVLANPWEKLLAVLGFCFKGIVVILTLVPIVYGLVLAMNGVDEIFGHICLLYLFEVLGLAALAGSLGILGTLFSAIRGVTIVFQLMISLPCWFIFGSIIYWCW